MFLAVCLFAFLSENIVNVNNSDPDQGKLSERIILTKILYQFLSFAFLQLIKIKLFFVQLQM